MRVWYIMHYVYSLPPSAVHISNNLYTVGKLDRPSVSLGLDYFPTRTFPTLRRRRWSGIKPGCGALRDIKEDMEISLIKPNLVLRKTRHDIALVSMALGTVNIVRYVTGTPVAYTIATDKAIRLTQSRVVNPAKAYERTQEDTPPSTREFIRRRIEILVYLRHAGLAETEMKPLAGLLHPCYVQEAQRIIRCDGFGKSPWITQHKLGCVSSEDKVERGNPLRTPLFTSATDRLRKCTSTTCEMHKGPDSFKTLRVGSRSQWASAIHRQADVVRVWVDSIDSALAATENLPVEAQELNDVLALNEDESIGCQVETRRG
ncbi:hypothetical protein CERSUDRAFT_124906 [Gelatoporia subvermispora B]|uniref:Uncharacterized protein n=1 Tax=Ceriporiopsis subvermispora (strain B) TaxID=914234 RepID=M2PHT9_CERS8|nr:hypothetical protein CERSUDRAFT_124906 [Gelatoporia subvermispora B]